MPLPQQLRHGLVFIAGVKTHSGQIPPVFSLWLNPDHSHIGPAPSLHIFLAIWPGRFWSVTIGGVGSVGNEFAACEAGCTRFWQFSWKELLQDGVKTICVTVDLVGSTATPRIPRASSSGGHIWETDTVLTSHLPEKSRPTDLPAASTLTLASLAAITIVWNTKQRISQLTAHNSFKDFTRWTCFVFLLFYLWIYNYKYRLWYWWVSLWHFHVACTLHWPQLTRPMLFLVSVFCLLPLPRPLTLP